MRVFSYMSDKRTASLEDGIQILQKQFNIKTMGISALFEAFILGTHAADTAQVVFLQHLDRTGMQAHYFKKSHIFCDRIRHYQLLWGVIGRVKVRRNCRRLHRDALFVFNINDLVFLGPGGNRNLDGIIQLVPDQGLADR